LYCPTWNDAKNEAVFGKCNNPSFHGHNYELIVSVKGEIDKQTGFVIDMGELKTLIYEQIECYFDHKNLNEQVPEFKTLNPTAENIAVVIWNRLRPFLAEKLALSITLYETPRNFVTYDGNN
jgi:6-pyruvoyltetrahydropterin/6-carboxytetrahydropterin synthase